MALQFWKIYREDSPYKRVSGILAIVWTLLILFLCFLPGKDIPDVKIPFVDKWVHFILFGVFAFLLMCWDPSKRIGWLILVVAMSVFLGWLVEYLQGQLPQLGRTQDNMDTLADSVGGVMGLALFLGLSGIANKKLPPMVED